VAKKIVIAGQRNIGSKVPSANIFESPNSTTAFDMATFTPKVNLTPSKPLYLDGKMNREYTMVTLEDLKYRSLQQAKDDETASTTLNINFDKKNLTNYAYFGSLKDLMTTSVANIISKWVGSILVDMYGANEVGEAYTRSTVKNYKYNPAEDTSSFSVPLYVVENKFGINLYETNSSSENGLRDMVLYYTSYGLLFNDKVFPILSFKGIGDDSQAELVFTVKGQPFLDGLVDDNVHPPMAVTFHVKPDEKEYRIFLKSLSTFERYLLSTDTDPNYTAVFKLPMEDENGEVTMVDSSITWPVSDGYNLDVDTWAYSAYLNELINIGNVYDEFKTNMLINNLTPRVIFDLDLTEEKKMEKLVKIYGRKYDEVKAFIDGLVYVNRIGYDKVETAPDALIKNLAETLGWDVVNFTTDNELFDSIFTTKATYQNKDFTPAEVDIELWRRILMNTSYFFKTKGTRQGIEAIFAMIGAPESLIEFNEHVYLAEDRVIRYDDDMQEYPIQYGVHFQQLDDSENGKDVYIDSFKERGFTLTRIEDNKKTATERNRFLINTKEISLNLSTAKPIEYDLYKSEPRIMSFLDYMGSLYNSNVDFRTNKIEYDYMTQSYPSLFEVLLKYYKETNDVMTFKRVLRYVVKFGGMWFKFVSQFIPATTIITEGGTGIRNTAFTPQKFKYKTSDAGDTGCLFITEQMDEISAEMFMMSIDGAYTMGVGDDEDAIVMQSSTGEVTTSDSTLVTNEYSYVTSQMQSDPQMSGTYTVIVVPKTTTSDVVKISANTIGSSNTIPLEKGLDTKKDITFSFDSIDNIVEFGVTLHEYAPAFGYFLTKIAHTQVFKKSDIVNNQIKMTIPALSLKGDTQYLVKPYFILDGEVSTKDDLDKHDSPYGIYRGVTDFYFPSISVPKRPFVYINSVIERKNPDTYSGVTITESFSINESLVVANTDELKITLENEVRENGVVIRINGSELVRGVDFYQSPINEKVILIKKASERQGQISVLYIVDDSNDVIYNLAHGSNLIEWDIDEKIRESENGYFRIEFALDSRTGFEVIDYSIRKDYTYNTTRFTEVLDTNSQSVQSGSVYKVRVVSNKTMNTLTDEILTSRVYSDYFKVRIP
jgi:hypothetical protein